MAHHQCQQRRLRWIGGRKHVASLTLAHCIYNMPTVCTSRGVEDRVYLQQRVSTDHRPPSPCARVTAIIDFFFRNGAFGPLPLALHLYNMPMVSTISRARLLVADSVYRPQTAIPMCTDKYCY